MFPFTSEKIPMMGLNGMKNTYSRLLNQPTQRQRKIKIYHRNANVANKNKIN